MLSSLSGIPKPKGQVGGKKPVAQGAVAAAPAAAAGCEGCVPGDPWKGPRVCLMQRPVAVHRLSRISRGLEKRCRPRERCCLRSLQANNPPRRWWRVERVRVVPAERGSGSGPQPGDAECCHTTTPPQLLPHRAALPDHPCNDLLDRVAAGVLAHSAGRARRQPWDFPRPGCATHLPAVTCFSSFFLRSS